MQLVFRSVFLITCLFQLVGFSSHPFRDIIGEPCLIVIETELPMHQLQEISGKIKCKNTDLNLKLTLTGGQSFRWKHEITEDTSESWVGVMRGCLWILSQSETHLHYKVICSNDTSKNDDINETYCEETLQDYFRLDVKLDECYQLWTEAHEHFKNNATNFLAIRVLNQEPLENLISFICSQNNHINRISSMVEKLCHDYGSKICTHNNIDYYAFPTLEELNVAKLEENLRTAKFGYRAGYISKAVKTIIDKEGMSWFEKLMTLPYKEAKTELVSIPGIGPKVADCICLMSLGHLDAIPVDTHIYKVAGLHYLPQLRKTKTVTTRAYEEVGDVFRKVYGPLAGWAQTVIFCADLERFSGKGIKKKKGDTPDKKN